jgi:hypothetical protein
MQNFRFRTEDLQNEEIPSLYVETTLDRQIIDALKAPNPIILEGSRGTGKSFLLRMAENELDSAFQTEHVLPIYVSFVKSSLIVTDDPHQFLHWMLARTCARLVRTLYSRGLVAPAPSTLSILNGGTTPLNDPDSGIESVAKAYEESYRNPGSPVDHSTIPDVEQFKDILEDLCRKVGIRRIALFFDEAAHIFRPAQQREFFTLFRDLRSPYIGCNAAVYPGVTSYGPTFQPAHDATVMEINRDILDGSYPERMREIVEKQADARLMDDIGRNTDNFNALAFAVSGNPRLLLKTVELANNMSSSQVTSVLKGFYRTTIWSEHSNLPERYAGHKALVDWGRSFIESRVIEDTRTKNTERIDAGRDESTCYFWIHRDAPAVVKEALRLLAYTGIVIKGDSGIRATRAELGTRYAVNLGCLTAPASRPIEELLSVARHLSPRRMTEYGAEHAAYNDLLADVREFAEPDVSEVLQRQLAKPISVLDITDFQKSGLESIEVTTVGDALRSSEAEFQTIDWIGPKRSRRMMNAAVASVLEYLSG